MFSVCSDSSTEHVQHSDFTNRRNESRIDEISVMSFLEMDPLIAVAVWCRNWETHNGNSSYFLQTHHIYRSILVIFAAEFHAPTSFQIN